MNAFRLRVGDYRVIYEFNAERNELHLITSGIGVTFTKKVSTERIDMTKFSFPFTEEKIRALKVGDEVCFPASCSLDATDDKDTQGSAMRKSCAGKSTLMALV